MLGVMATVTAPSEARYELRASASCKKVWSQAEHARYTRQVYGRNQVTRKAQKRVREMVRCQHTGRAREKARRLTRRVRNRYKARKQQTPHGKWAIPAYIVMCESGGDYNAQNPSGAYGAYQLMPTWWSHLGRKPTPAEQDAIAAKLWAGGAGASHWVCA